MGRAACVKPSRILYAQVREDPEADLQALQIVPEDRVLAVTSGGCTALRLLAEGPRELVCVDFNPAQNALLELKLAAIRKLPVEECRSFLGARKGNNRLSVYRTLLGGLSPTARDFWNARPHLIEKGVLYAGKTEAMTRVMKRILFGFIHSPETVRVLLKQRDVGAQARFYREVWSTRRWKALLKVAFHPLVFQKIYGPRFLERLGEEDVTRLWIRKLEHAFTEIPVRSNYFLSQLLWARFLPGEEGLPPYLRKGVFERIRANAGRLRWITGDVASVLASSPLGYYSKATLSNTFEWLPEERIGPAFDALAHALAPNGRAVLRHLLGVTPLPKGVFLRELEPVSSQMTRQERAFLYSRVSVYERTAEP
ncbi:MAG: BtaA family protein [Candidatus Omnitrophica bacterium]|nr:BtaA family protein [Candidatus Omnitrophota bacterium]